MIEHQDGSLAVLQIIPRLKIGGAERAVIDISRALNGAGMQSFVTSQGGELVPDLLHTKAIHVEMPVASKNPLTIALNRPAPCPSHPHPSGGRDPCPIQGAGLVRLPRGAAHVDTDRHHVPCPLHHQFQGQAPLQLGDGARRPGDRHLRVRGPPRAGGVRGSGDSAALHLPRHRHGAFRPRWP